jgi:hypothetical protein
VGPRAGLGDMEKRNSNSDPAGTRTLTPRFQLVSSRCIDCTTEQHRAWYCSNLLTDSSASCNKMMTCNHERISFTPNIASRRDVHSKLHQVTVNFPRALHFFYYILPNDYTGFKAWFRNHIQNVFSVVRS